MGISRISNISDFCNIQYIKDNPVTCLAALAISSVIGAVFLKKRYSPDMQVIFSREGGGLEVSLMQKRVNQRESDLVWRVYERSTGRTYWRDAIEDLEECPHTYLKNVVNFKFHYLCKNYKYLNSDFVKKSPALTLEWGDLGERHFLGKFFDCMLRNNIIDQSQRQAYEKSYRRTSKQVWPGHDRVSNTVRESAVRWLRTIPIKNRIEYFKDHEIRVITESGGAARSPVLKKITARSRFDGSVIIDRNNWAITLLCYGDWLGHASIAIEGVENGVYFESYAHLTADKAFSCSGAQTAKIKLHPGKVSTEFTSKTRTVTRPSYDVQRMLEKIKAEENKPEEFPVYFNILSSEKTGRVKSDNEVCCSLQPHNCLTWAKETVDYADVSFLFEDSGVQSIPAAAIGPRSLFS